jgi:NDP-sugar pyrophosphorylase family protein
MTGAEKTGAEKTGAEKTGAEKFRAVILAGGRGSRLYPFTASLPKPLLPVGERPVIEHIVRRLAASGAVRMTVAVNYLADLVESFFGDGRRFGVAIDYVREAMPLGTAGPIGLVEPWTGPLLVTNGDVLSDIDFSKLLSYHREHAAALTVTTMLQSLRVESGVVTTDPSLRVTGIVEKPEVRHRISIGTYVLGEAAAGCVVPNERLEMPELIVKLIERGETVIAYDHTGVWLDIGKPEDFAKAQAEAATWSQMLGVNRIADGPNAAAR